MLSTILLQAAAGMGVSCSADRNIKAKINKDHRCRYRNRIDR